MSLTIFAILASQSGYMDFERMDVVSNDTRIRAVARCHATKDSVMVDAMILNRTSNDALIPPLSINRVEFEFIELRPGSKGVAGAHPISAVRNVVIPNMPTLERDQLWALEPASKVSLNARFARNRFPRDLARVRLRVRLNAWVFWEESSAPYPFQKPQNGQSYFDLSSDWSRIQTTSLASRVRL